MEGFKVKYTGQLEDAKKTLVYRNIKTEEEVKNMTKKEIVEAINKNFVCYECGEDWLAIPKEKEKEFNKMTDWICR